MTETSLVPVSRIVIEHSAWPRLQPNAEQVQSRVDVRFLLRAECVEAVGIADLDQPAGDPGSAIGCGAEVAADDGAPDGQSPWSMTVPSSLISQAGKDMTTNPFYDGRAT